MKTWPWKSSWKSTQIAIPNDRLRGPLFWSGQLELWLQLGIPLHCACCACCRYQLNIFGILMLWFVSINSLSDSNLKYLQSWAYLNAVKCQMPSLLIPVSLRSNRQERMRRRFGLACYAGQPPCALPEPTFYAISARRVWFVAARGISDHGAVCSTVALHGPRIARVDTSLRFVAVEWFVLDFFVPAPAILIPS